MAIDISVVLIFGNGDGVGFDRRGGSVELKSGSNRDVIIRNPIVMHRATETDEMVDPLTVSHSDNDSDIAKTI